MPKEASGKPPSRAKKDRSVKYEAPLVLKEGVTFMDIMQASVKDAKSRNKKKP